MYNIGMITIEKLNAFGADTKTGLARCMNKEDFPMLENDIIYLICLTQPFLKIIEKQFLDDLTVKIFSTKILVLIKFCNPETILILLDLCCGVFL